MNNRSTQTATSRHTRLDAQRQGFVDQVNDLARQVERMVDGLTSEQFNWKPAPEKWSIAECLEHIATTDGRVLDGLEKEIEAARAKGLRGEGPFKLGFIGGQFVKSLEPTSTYKGKTPAVYAPSSRLDMPQVLELFTTTCRRAIEAIEASEGLDLSKIKMQSPALKLLRLNAAAWFATITTHGRRHLQQAMRVRNDPRFPAG